MTPPHKMTPVNLKERIAALQQRTASSTSKTPSSSISPSGNLRERIAKFEKGGGIPVPRGSFGLGAPPSHDDGSERRKGELYGNRIASVGRVLPLTNHSSTLGVADGSRVRKRCMSTPHSEYEPIPESPSFPTQYMNDDVDSADPNVPSPSQTTEDIHVPPPSRRKSAIGSRCLSDASGQPILSLLTLSVPTTQDYAPEGLPIEKGPPASTFHRAPLGDSGKSRSSIVFPAEAIGEPLELVGDRQDFLDPGRQPVPDTADHQSSTPTPSSPIAEVVANPLINAVIADEEQLEYAQEHVSDAQDTQLVAGQDEQVVTCQAPAETTAMNGQALREPEATTGRMVEAATSKQRDRQFSGEQSLSSASPDVEAQLRAVKSGVSYTAEEKHEIQTLTHDEEPAVAVMHSGQSLNLASGSQTLISAPSVSLLVEDVTNEGENPVLHAHDPDGQFDGGESAITNSVLRNAPSIRSRNPLRSLKNDKGKGDDLVGSIPKLLYSDENARNSRPLPEEEEIGEPGTVIVNPPTQRNASTHRSHSSKDSFVSQSSYNELTIEPKTGPKSFHAVVHGKTKYGKVAAEANTSHGDTAQSYDPMRLRHRHLQDLQDVPPTPATPELFHLVAQAARLEQQLESTVPESVVVPASHRRPARKGMEVKVVVKDKAESDGASEIPPTPPPKSPQWLQAMNASIPFPHSTALASRLQDLHSSRESWSSEKSSEDSTAVLTPPSPSFDLNTLPHFNDAYADHHRRSSSQSSSSLRSSPRKSSAKKNSISRSNSFVGRLLSRAGRSSATLSLPDGAEGSRPPSPVPQFNLQTLKPTVDAYIEQNQDVMISSRPHSTFSTSTTSSASIFSPTFDRDGIIGSFPPVPHQALPPRSSASPGPPPAVALPPTPTPSPLNFLALSQSRSVNKS